MAARPFRFGVQVSAAPDGPAWRERARRIEGQGYSTLWMPDHFGDQWGPLVGLTVAAEATTTLRVGSLVLGNDYRHPAVVAKEMATLDVASGGRVEVGIGAGWLRRDYSELGFGFDEPAVRVARLGEALTALKALWSGEPAHLEGTHYRLDGCRGRPAPLQRPHPPLLVAGGGRAVLSLAARHAGIVGFNASLAAGEVGHEVARQATAARFRQRVAWVREAAGERFDDLELQCYTAVCLVGVRTRQAAETLGPAMGLSVEEAEQVPIALAGEVPELCDILEQRRCDYGFTYWSIPEAAADAFAPVVARLTGT